MSRLYASCLIFALALAAGLAGASDVAAKDWRRHRSTADFPARVKSISYPSWGTIKDGTCGGWGRWQVCFGKTRPLATMIQCDSTACPHLVIHDLQCTNPAVGTQQCNMYVVHMVQSGQGYCFISGKENHPNKVYIKINCPSDVTLE